jgi:hypothetical protein
MRSVAHPGRHGAKAGTDGVGGMADTSARAVHGRFHALANAFHGMAQTFACAFHT